MGIIVSWGGSEGTRTKRIRLCTRRDGSTHKHGNAANQWVSKWNEGRVGHALGTRLCTYVTLHRDHLINGHLAI